MINNDPMLDAPMEAVPTTVEPQETMEQRKAKLKAVSEAHNEWVAEKDEAGEIPGPDEYDSEFSDANQFAGDALLPQDDFVAKVDEKTQALASEGGTQAPEPLDKAVEGLQALIDAIRAAKQ